MKKNEDQFPDVNKVSYSDFPEGHGMMTPETMDEMSTYLTKQAKEKE